MKKNELYPSQKLDQYMLRFPDGMRQQLKDIAAKNGRSLNAEIIARLELTLEVQGLEPNAMEQFDKTLEEMRSMRTQVEQFMNNAEEALEKTSKLMEDVEAFAERNPHVIKSK